MLKPLEQIFNKRFFQLNIFVILLMAVFVFSSGHFIFVKAFNNQINIFPGGFYLEADEAEAQNWKNIEKAFYQDLSPQAEFDRFNTANSAHIISGAEPADIGGSAALSPEEKLENTEGSADDPETRGNQEEIGAEDNENIQNTGNNVESNVEPEINDNSSEAIREPKENYSGEPVQEIIPGGKNPEDESVEEPAPPADEAQAENQPPPASNQPPDGADAAQESGETSLFFQKGRDFFTFLANNWKPSGIFGFSSASAQSGASSGEDNENDLGFNRQNSLSGPGAVFSDFSVPIDYVESGLGQAMLMLSLAARSNIDSDKLLLQYNLGGAWRDLDALKLNARLSNADNGGYYQFPLPLETWQDIEQLQIKIVYQPASANRSEDAFTEIYLDALWLALEYNESFEEAEAGAEQAKALEAEEGNFDFGIELNLLSDRTVFNNREQPKFDFRYKKLRTSFLDKVGAGIMNIFRDEYKNAELRAEVMDNSGRLFKNIKTDISYRGDGKFSVSLSFDRRQFRPGEYKLKIKIIDGGVVYEQFQDFSWGVLAFNSNQSIYLPGERAYLQMGVLDNGGHTLCDADLYLEISAPDGGIAYLDTDNGLVARNENCAGDTVIEASDYYAYYNVGGSGDYRIKLRAVTESGEKIITDYFQVWDSVPFSIERVGPTRIFPLADYAMKFRIKAFEDYAGDFQEFVPGSFRIVKAGPSDLGFNLSRPDDEKILTWRVDWQAGKTYEIYYIFDAPNISPEFYLLGPAETADFAEIRQWQIAGDAVATYDCDMGYTNTGGFTNPQYAWDSTNGQYATYDYERQGRDGPANYLQASSSDISDLGSGYTITKVEIGMKGYGESGDVNAEVIPYFGGSTAGDIYEIPKGTIGSSDSGNTFYREITSDAAGPGLTSWTWSDLMNLEVRVWGDNDNNGQSRMFYVDQINIQVEYDVPNDAPTTTNMTAIQKKDGSGTVDISFEASDNDGNDLQAIVEYESGAGCSFVSPLDPSLDETDATATSTYGDAKIDNGNFYQIGNASGWIETASGTNLVSFDWLSRSDLPAGDGTYCLRVRANDTRATSTAATTTVTIDNAAPSQPGNLAVFATSGTSVILTLGSASSDSHFDEYRIYYKEYDGSDPDTGDSLWDSGDDGNLDEDDYNSATSTTITDLFPSTQYIFNIFAVDTYGNLASATTAVLATTSAQEVPPVLTINSLAQKTDGSGVLDISIEVDDGNDDNVRVKMEYEAGTDCLFLPPLDPVLDETPANILADDGTVIIDNASAYQIGTSTGWIPTLLGSNTVNFDWLTRSHDPDLDGTYCARFTANDLNSGDQANPATSTLIIDNTAPTAPGQMSATSTDRSVTLYFGASSTEINFSEYKIFYRAGSSGVTESDTEFNSSDDSSLGYQDYNGEESVTISGLSPEVQYVFNIYAYDDYGNKASSTEVSATTLEAEPIRAKTVMFAAGTYSGSGAAGQNTNTDNSFPSFNFRLAEGDVEIKNAYIIFESHFEAYGDNGDYTGYNLAFDACQESCSADAFSGSGRVLKDDDTVLAFDETESNQVRLLLDVTSETQLAAYTGDGVNMEGRVGYRLETGGAVQSIASARAILVITYTYNENSTSNLTNTVIYPLESEAGGDSGTRRSVQSDDCTLDSDCPLFTYNMRIPEFSERLSDWFTLYSAVDRNSGLGKNYQDIYASVNIEGENINSANFIYELEKGLTQSHLPAMNFKSVYGFAENSTSSLEARIYCSGDDANFYLLGGEVYETYIASSSASLKTRTVSFPIGVVNNGLTTNQTSASVDVYFPENGAGSGIVSVKKAWVRLISSNHTAAGNITVATDVGDNAQSGNYVYAYDTDTAVAKPSFNIIHVIPSSDYSELASANADAGKTVTVYTTNNTANQGGMSAELMITYTYTDESNGYLSSLNLFAGQSGSDGNSQLATATVARAVLPELIGDKTILSGALMSSYLVSSDDAGGVPSAAFTLDANLATSGPSCNNAFNSRPLDSNMFTEFYKGVTSALTSADEESYIACYSNNGGGNANTGAKMNGQLIYVYQYDAPSPVFTQNDWRWYENNDAVEPSIAKAAENTAISNINLADILRLRINVGITGRALATTSEIFTLQYGHGSDCASISEWNSVSAIGGGGPWEGHNNASVADGYSSSSALLASSTVFESYEEANPSTANPRRIEKNAYGEWDWVLYNNAASSSRDYCFRMVNSSGAFDTYNADGYAKLTTAATNTAPAAPGNLGQFWNDGITAIPNTGWINENIVKLRARATDVNINEDLYLYFEIATNTDSFITSTSVPSNACNYGTAHGSCDSKVWVATSTSGDYRSSAFIATTSITGIPDSSIGYKWQVMACDDDGDCSDWVQFGTGPNFRVDITPPSPPGKLSFVSADATSITVAYGASSTEVNFKNYRMYYKAGAAGVGESDLPHNDSDLNSQNYNNATNTTIINLSAGTEYTFNIWAYDFAGNSASATLPLVGTTTSSFATPTAAIFSLAQKTNGSGAVDIAISVDDPDNDDTLRARVFYSAGSGCEFSPPQDMTIDPVNISDSHDGYPDPVVDNDSLFQVGTTTGWILTSPGAGYVFFDWLSQNEEPAANGTYCIGLVVSDGWLQTATNTKLIIVDNVAPSAPGALSLEEKNRNSITVSFGGQSIDTRFDRYRIFYSTTSPVTVYDSEHTDYFGATTTNYGGLATTTITGLSPGTLYYINIWAYDDLGNKASSSVVLATSTNSIATNTLAIGQYLSDEITAIANSSWINRNEVRLVASANDPDISELPTLYYEFIANGSSFRTATTVPQNACVYGTSYSGCSASYVWYSAPASPGNYSVSPYIATTSITSIPNSANGYKWQVLACDDDGDCANNWARYNDSLPNIKVDNISPSAPGALSEYSKTSSQIVLSFGSATDEANFYEYQIFYSTTSPVSENDIQFASTSDSNLAAKNYNNAATTTLSGLESNTTYYINIWAYDLAGNKASSTQASIATNPVASTPGVLFYTKNERTLYYRVWSGSGWGAEQSGATLGSNTGDNIRHIRALRSDDGKRIGILAKTWDGTNQEWWGTVYRVAADDFVNTEILGSAYNSGTNAQLISGCIGYLSGGEYIIVRSNNGSSGTLVYSWNAADGWTSEGSGPDPGGVLNGCQLIRRPDTDNYLLTTFDDTSHGGGGGSGDVGSDYYIGGSTYADSWAGWTEHGYPEEDTDNFVGEAFFDPADNTRGAINYSASNNTSDTKIKKFIVTDSTINYGVPVTSPATWAGDFVHGEFAADPGSTGVAFYAGDDVNGDLNIYKVNISTSTPSWYIPANGDNISGSGLYAYTNDAQKPYAIGFYKNNYGLVAWNESAAATPKYRVIDASANSLDAGNTAVPGADANVWSRVRFYEDPNENELLAVYQNDDVDYSAVFWNGAEDRFYNSADDSDSSQIWTELVAAAGPFDRDDEATSFAFTAGNSFPNSPYNLTQYKSDALTTIANGGWTNENEVKFEISVKDADTSEVLRVYLELIAGTGDFATTTGVPENVCASTTPFESCNSGIWAIATSTAGDYSINPFVATATITSLPESYIVGYKWQVKVCDDDDACSSWIKYNANTPNFYVDYTAPQDLDPLEVSSKTSTSITLDFGAAVSEDNFSHYRIFYSTSTPVAESDYEHTDSDLNSQNYGGDSNTTVYNLDPETLYYFNIWAYDLAGNKASSTIVSTTTDSSYYLVQTAYIIENDDGVNVNSNTNAAAANTPLNNLYKGERFIARIQIENNGGDMAANKIYKLQYENQTDSPGAWSDVGAATPISYSDGLSGANNDDLISAEIANGDSSFTFGKWHEGVYQTAGFDLDNGEFTEFAFAVHTYNAAAGKTYRLRLYNESDASELDASTATATISIISPSRLRYSKGTYESLLTNYNDLTYYLDPAGYSDTASDDGSRDIATSSENYAVFNFVVSTTTNTQAISASWNGQSSDGTATSTVYLQVFRFGSTNAWVTAASNSTTSENTDFDLSASINSSISEYYNSNVTYWRVYQESGSQALRTDYFALSFSDPEPEAKQLHYRWRHDDGDETSATWREEEDTGSPTASSSLERYENIRLRIAVANTGGGSAVNYLYQIEYATSTGNCSQDARNWQSVATDGSRHWQMATSSYFGNGSTTTAQLDNAEAYSFTSGYMVESPKSTTSAITLSENHYTEVEYIIFANTNAVSAGTYCFRATNNGAALDDYDDYPVLTLSGVTNTAPAFTPTGHPSDNGSATNSPTDYGTDVEFSATAEDGEGDNYYLAICKTNSITAGNDTAPTCSGGAWCISDLATSSEAAYCNYTAATSSEVLEWYGFVCDKYPGFAVGKCSAYSQGNSTAENNSPFVVNHPPVFTSVSTTDDNKNPGGTFTITTVSYDNDSIGGNDTLDLYVCTMDNANSGGCQGAGNVEICSAIATSSPNAKCKYTDTAPTPAGDTAYYAFIFDNNGLEAATNSRSSTFTINNVAPVLGALELNGGADITLSPRPLQTAVSLISASVVDNNGCDSGLVSAVAAIYMSANSNSCSHDPNECYQITTDNCVKTDCDGDDDNIATYTCSVNFEYYANPTDDYDLNNPWRSYEWLGWMRVFDGLTYVASTSPGVDVKTTLAFEVTENLIDFGDDLYIGYNTGTRNATTTVINAGNCPITTRVIGTDMDGSFGMDPIAVGQIKWSLTEGFNYTAAGTALTTGETPVPISAPKPTSSATSSDAIYWGIGIPLTTYPDIYYGENTFILEIDSEDW